MKHYRDVVSTQNDDIAALSCYRSGMITPDQCRAARALLDITQRELATLAGLGESTIRDFEASRRTPLDESLAALERALEKAGVELIDAGEASKAGGAGVRLKRVRPPIEP